MGTNSTLQMNTPNIFKKTILLLTLMLQLVVANSSKTKEYKKREKWLNPWHIVRAIQWIPTQQGSDVFQKS